MARRSVDRIRINVYFQERVLEGLRILADAKGTTYSELIREACRKYVVDEGGKTLKDSQIIKELTK